METNLQNVQEIQNFRVGQTSNVNSTENLRKNIVLLNAKIISFHKKSYSFFFKTAGVKHGKYYIKIFKWFCFLIQNKYFDFKSNKIIQGTVLRFRLVIILRAYKQL